MGAIAEQTPSSNTTPMYLAFFSTEGGSFSPRAVDHDALPPPVIRTDLKSDMDKMIQKLRARWPHQCNGIFAKSSQGHTQWHLSWFFDEYDFYVLGGRFLYDLLSRMQKQNEEGVRSFVNNWNEANKQEYKNINFETMTVANTFGEADQAELGQEFLKICLRHMKSKYDCAKRHCQQEVERFYRSLTVPVGLNHTTTFTPSALSPNGDLKSQGRSISNGEPQDGFAHDPKPAQADRRVSSLQEPPTVSCRVKGAQQQYQAYAPGLHIPMNNAFHTIASFSHPYAGIGAYAPPDIQSLPHPGQTPSQPYYSTSVNARNYRPLAVPDDKPHAQPSLGVPHERAGGPKRNRWEETYVQGIRRQSFGNKFNAPPTPNRVPPLGLRRGSNSRDHHLSSDSHGSADFVRARADSSRTHPTIISPVSIGNLTNLPLADPSIRLDDARRVANDPSMVNGLTISDTFLGKDVDYVRTVFIGKHFVEDFSEEELYKCLKQLEEEVEYVSFAKVALGEDARLVFAGVRSTAAVRRMIGIKRLECRGIRLSTAIPYRYHRTGLEGPEYEIPESYRSQNTFPPWPHDAQTARERRSSSSSWGARSEVKSFYSPQDVRSAVPTLSGREPSQGYPSNPIDAPRIETSHTQEPPSFKRSPPPKKGKKQAKLEIIDEEQGGQSKRTKTLKKSSPASSRGEHSSACRTEKEPSSGQKSRRAPESNADLPVSNHTALSDEAAAIPDVTGANSEEIDHPSTETVASLSSGLDSVAGGGADSLTRKYASNSGNPCGPYVNVLEEQPGALFFKDPMIVGNTLNDDSSTTSASTHSEAVPKKASNDVSAHSKHSVVHSAGLPLERRPSNVASNASNIESAGMLDSMLFKLQCDDVADGLDPMMSTSPTSPTEVAGTGLLTVTDNDQAEGKRTPTVPGPQSDDEARDYPTEPGQVGLGLALDSAQSLGVQHPGKEVHSLSSSQHTSQGSSDSLLRPVASGRSSSNSGTTKAGTWRKELVELIERIKKLREGDIDRWMLEAKTAECLLESVEQKQRDSFDKVQNGGKTMKKTHGKRLKQLESDYDSAYMDLAELRAKFDREMPTVEVSQPAKTMSKASTPKYPPHSIDNAVHHPAASKHGQWPTVTTSQHRQKQLFSTDEQHGTGMNVYSVGLGGSSLVARLPSTDQLAKYQVVAQLINDVSTIEPVDETTTTPIFSIGDTDKTVAKEEQQETSRVSSPPPAKQAKMSYASVAKKSADSSPAATPLPKASSVAKSNAKKQQNDKRNPNSAEWRVEGEDDWSLNGGFKRGG